MAHEPHTLTRAEVDKIIDCYHRSMLFDVAIGWFSSAGLLVLACTHEPATGLLVGTALVFLATCAFTYMVYRRIHKEREYRAARDAPKAVHLPPETLSCRLCNGEPCAPWVPYQERDGRPTHHTCHPGEERATLEAQARSPDP